MKSKKKLIISMVVLALVTVLCFVTGAVCIAAGGVQAIAESDLPEKLSELDVDDIDDFIEEIGSCVPGFVTVTYNDDYDVAPMAYEHTEYDTIIIEDVSYDLKIVRGFGQVAFSGKYPTQIDKEELVNVDTLNQTSLVISTKNVTGGIMTGNAGTLTVSIPAEFTGEIVIRDCAGSIKLSDVWAGKLTFDSAVGNINAENMHIPTVVLDSLVGEVRYAGEFTGFEIADCLGDIEMETGTVLENESKIVDCLGDIEMTFADGTTVNTEKSGNLGDVDIEVDDTADGVEVEITDNLGSIHFDYD